MDKTAFDRRTLLRGALAALCASCVPLVAAQQGKVSKEEAQYQDAPKGDQHCANCNHFMAESNGCALVTGQVSPDGWCTLWTGPPGAQPDTLGRR